jgi:2',3'-cyclic-nucleotide 2'-phosphodiesterase (5'-nucleotidase family)
VTAAVKAVKDDMTKIVDRQVAITDYELTINGPNGRLVRSGETNLGDLIADAFRTTMDTDIGLVNGGGVRNSIPAGVITYGHIIDVLPNDNYICIIEVSGADLQKMLQLCTVRCPAEDGNFPQVSGMRYTIHTASHIVSDVEVMDTEGTYQPIVETQMYTVALSDYYITMGFDDLESYMLVERNESLVRDVLAYYLEKTLGGTTGTTYAQSGQRITIVND